MPQSDAPNHSQDPIVISSDEEDCKDELDISEAEGGPDEPRRSANLKPLGLQKVSCYHSPPVDGAPNQRLRSYCPAPFEADFEDEVKNEVAVASASVSSHRYGQGVDSTECCTRGMDGSTAKTEEEVDELVKDEIRNDGVNIAGSLQPSPHELEIHSPFPAPSTNTEESAQAIPLSVARVAPSSYEQFFARCGDRTTQESSIHIQRLRPLGRHDLDGLFVLSSAAAASTLLPREAWPSDPITRATSSTLPSEPRGSSSDPIVNTLPSAPQDAGDCTSCKASQRDIDDTLSRPEAVIHDASPTPSEGEVDKLIQIDRGSNLENTSAQATPPPPNTHPQSASISVNGPSTYTIPHDVPWRQPQHFEDGSSDSLADWARKYALARTTASRPSSHKAIGTSLAPESPPVNLAVDGIAMGGLYSIADPGEGSFHATRGTEEQPDDPEDPVVRFLQDVSLSPALAEKLRKVGISDEQRIRALGGLGYRVLGKLEKALAEAGIDYVARLLIIEGLKKRATPGR